MGGSEEFWEVGGVFGSSDEFLGGRRSFGRVSEEISGGGGVGGGGGGGGRGLGGAGGGGGGAGIRKEFYKMSLTVR